MSNITMHYNNFSKCAAILLLVAGLLFSPSAALAAPALPAPQVVPNAPPPDAQLVPEETAQQEQTYPATQPPQTESPPPDSQQSAAAPALTPDQLLKSAGLPPPAPEDKALDNLEMPGVAPPIDERLLEPPQLSEEEQKAEINQDAYDAAVQGIFPMDTDQIRGLIQKQDDTNKAVETPLYPYPKPEVTFTTVSLDPGQPPVQIKLAVGHVTTLSLLDITGQPWSVQDISWAGNFEVIQPETGSHVLRITPLSDFAYGNLSMRLLNLNTPVTFALRTGRDAVQYRLDIRVPEYGPQATPPLIDQGGISIVAGDKTLSSVLDGIPPGDASKLTVTGLDARSSAYQVGGTMYLRTPHTLLSPAWQSSVRSADGTNVYALVPAPVLLLSDRGRMVRATLDMAVPATFPTTSQQATP